MDTDDERRAKLAGALAGWPALIKSAEQWTKAGRRARVNAPPDAKMTEVKLLEVAALKAKRREEQAAHMAAKAIRREKAQAATAARQAAQLEAKRARSRERRAARRAGLARPVREQRAVEMLADLRHLYPVMREYRALVGDAGARICAEHPELDAPRVHEAVMRYRLMQQHLYEISAEGARIFTPQGEDAGAVGKARRKRALKELVRRRGRAPSAELDAAIKQAAAAHAHERAKTEAAAAHARERAEIEASYLDLTKIEVESQDQS